MNIFIGPRSEIQSLEIFAVVFALLVVADVVILVVAVVAVCFVFSFAVDESDALQKPLAS